MDNCEDEGVRQASLQIQSQFFYEESNLHLLVSLSKDLVPRSKRYLECVVDTIHKVIELVDTNWNSENGGIITRKIRKGPAVTGFPNG